MIDLQAGGLCVLTRDDVDDHVGKVHGVADVVQRIPCINVVTLLELAETRSRHNDHRVVDDGNGEDGQPAVVSVTAGINHPFGTKSVNRQIII